MKAFVKTQRVYGSTILKDVEKPQVQSNEVLIKIKAAAVCGSDLHAYEYPPGYEFINIPITLGHEYSGVVEEVGDAVHQFKPGDRVMGESNQDCGYCANCHAGRTNICTNNKMTGLHINGGMAEYISIPECIVHKIPEGVSFAEAAVAQPCSVSFHGVFDKSGIEPADTVVIFGHGIVGLMAAQGAKIMGARKIFVVGTEADAAKRLPLAEQMGFITINCDRTDIESAIGMELGISEVDVAIECSGAVAALKSCVGLVRKGGSLTLLGIYSKPLEIFFTPIIRNEIKINTSYTCTYDNYEQALQLIASGQIDLKPLIVKYSFVDSQRAFIDALDKKVLKPVLMLD